MSAIVVLTPEELRELVRAAVRDELATHAPVASAGPLLDKLQLAVALCVSPATVDRLIAKKQIPWLVVGDVKRFDLATVRKVLEHGVDKDAPKKPAEGEVLRLSRGSR